MLALRNPTCWLWPALIVGFAFGVTPGCPDDPPIETPADLEGDSNGDLEETDFAADSREDVVASQVRVRFDLGGGFFDAPFPIETRRRSDGTVMFSDFPNPEDNQLLENYLSVADTNLSGFSCNGSVLFPFDGAIDPSQLPQTLDESLQPDSAVFFVNIDPTSPEVGGRFPVQVAFNERAGLLIPENLLTVLPYPGFVQRPETLYAAVVLSSGLTDHLAQPLGQAPELEALLSGELPSEFGDLANIDALLTGFVALADVLADSGVPLDEVVAATVYRTGDPITEMVTLREHALSLPPPEARIIEQIRDEPEYCVLEGRVTVPIYQVGERPYNELGHGHIVFEEGQPVVQWTEEIRFSLSLPKTTQPSDGFPLLLYAAGQGGRYTQVLDRGTFTEQSADPENGRGPAHYLALSGIASLGFEASTVGPRHPTGSFEGIAFFNIQNLAAFRDNVRQAAVEFTVLARMAQTMEIELGDLCPDVQAADDRVTFDSERLLFWGHSTGASIGDLVLAVEPAFLAGILSGTGGSWLYNVALKEEPIVIRTLMSTLLRLEPDEALNEFHPVAMAFQTAVEPAEPMNFARHWFQEPLQGGLGTNVLLVEGLVDGYFPPRMVAALAMSGHFDLAGPVHDSALLEDIQRVGGAALTLPAQPNRGDLSGTVVQFVADDFDGHYVIFNLDGPKYLYRCWLESLLETGSAVVPELFDDGEAVCP